MNENKRLNEIQKNFSGSNYIGASLSSFKTSNKIRSELHEWLKNKTKFLILSGPAGTGKTYVASALIEYLLPKANFIRGYRESALFDKLRKYYSEGMNGSFNDFLRYQIDDTVVLIDDIGQCSKKGFTEDVIFEVLEFRKSIPGITVFTTNHNKDSFRNMYGERSASRLFAGENKVIDFSGLKDLRAF